MTDEPDPKSDEAYARAKAFTDAVLEAWAQTSWPWWADLPMPRWLRVRLVRRWEAP
jgi:hypothetical protein